MLHKSNARVKTKNPDVVHTKLNQLAAVEGHQNYYVNLISGKISYKKGAGKWIHTGETRIMSAQKIVQERLLSMEKGVSPSEAKRRITGVKDGSITQYYNELMELKEVESKPSTMRTYWRSFNQGFGPFWKDKTVSEITHANVLQYKAWYLKNHPKRHFEHTLIHLGMLFRYMHKMGYLSKIPDLTPLDSVQEVTDRNSKRQKPGRVLRPDEEKKLIAALPKIETHYKKGGTTKDHKAMLTSRASLAILLGLKAGMRKGEICVLPWKRIYEEAEYFWVWSDKNMTWRKIPWTKLLRKAFDEQFKFTGHTEWVFPMPSDITKPLSPQVMDKVWIKVKKLAGIQGRLRFHDLRHTFATRTGEEGWPVSIACKVLDMSIPIYQKVYCKPSDEKISEWMNKHEKDEA